MLWSVFPMREMRMFDEYTEPFDDSYHYPPELLNLLIDAIPALFRSKRDVLSFFRGAGVPSALFADWNLKVQQNRDAVKKHEIAHSVLCRLNERQDNDSLRHRREVLRRIVGIEDFSTCWSEDQQKAELFVSRIRQVVNVKDSFTRMRQERDKG